MGILSHCHVWAKAHRLLLLTVLAAVLYAGAGIALAWVAGFEDVWRGVQHPSWPWLLASFGFGIALWAAERYRDRLRGGGGWHDWRERLSILLDAAHLIGAMFGHPLRYARAITGMLLYWLGDMWALWAAMAAFGFRMNAATE